MLGKLTHVFQVMISHSLSLAFSHCFPILSHAIQTLAELILTCIPLNDLGTVICHMWPLSSSQAIIAIFSFTFSALTKS